MVWNRWMSFGSSWQYNTLLYWGFFIFYLEGTGLSLDYQTNWTLKIDEWKNQKAQQSPRQWYVGDRSGFDTCVKSVAHTSGTLKKLNISARYIDCTDNRSHCWFQIDITGLKSMMDRWICWRYIGLRGRGNPSYIADIVTLNILLVS